MSEGGAKRAGRSQPAASAARAFLGRLDRGGGMRRARAVSAWQEVAGEEVAEHAMGFALREGELVVFCDSALWATELSALSERYREAVNARIGEEVVRSVRFAVSKETALRRDEARRERAAQEERDRDKVDAVPVTETELAQIEQMASSIADPVARAAAVRAAAAHLSWQKGLRRAGRPAD